jgi:uncharacterized protein
MKTTTSIALILVIVGGLNWLLVGLFQYDLVAGIFGGQDAVVSRIVYVLVGISAIWLMIQFPGIAVRRTDLGMERSSTTRTPPAP